MSLRLAIVGCGLMTERTHLPATMKASGISVEALVDSDIARARALASRFGVGTVGATLADVASEVDAILIVTPPHVRVALVREAVALGLHMLCEKPLANTHSECMEMLRLAEGSGLVAAGAHVYRFWPAREWIKEALRSGELGRAVAVHASQGMPYSWKSVSGYTVRKELVPGGVLINAGIHPLDTLLWWFGDARIESYMDDALGGLESNVDLRLDFHSGVQGGLVMSRTHRLDHVIRISTTKCEIELSTYSRNAIKIVEGGVERHVVSGDADVDELGPTVAQLEDFAEAIMSGRAPRVGFVEAARVITLVDECYALKKARALPATAPIPGAVW